MQKCHLCGKEIVGKVYLYGDEPMDKECIVELLPKGEDAEEYSAEDS